MFWTIYNAVTMLFDIYNGITMFLQIFSFFCDKNMDILDIKHAIVVVWIFTLVLPCFWTCIVLLYYLQTFITILPCFLDIFHRCNMENLLCGYLFILRHLVKYYCGFFTNIFHDITVFVLIQNYIWTFTMLLLYFCTFIIVFTFLMI